MLILVTATTPEVIRAAVQSTIDNLGSKPDVLLIHNPYVFEEGKIGEGWKILESLVEDGTLVGVSLGVSNFRPQDLQAILDVCKIKPVINRECLLPLFTPTSHTPRISKSAMRCHHYCH